MTAPSLFYTDESVSLYHGDALTVLTSLPDASVNCCVTSPPYFGLRDYGVDGQFGLEASPSEYVENLRAVFAQVRRVLADDGTLWLNLGDSFSGGERDTYDTVSGITGNRGVSARRPRTGLPAKNLLGIPWRVAFALQDDGWILRNDIIWAKPNGMPESVTDRVASKHEYVFLFSKRARYWFDLDPIREPHADVSLARSGRNRFAIDQSQQGVGSPNTLEPKQAIHDGGKNPGDVWGIPTHHVSAAHSFKRETKEVLAPGQAATQHRDDRLDVDARNPQGRNPGDIWAIPTAPFPEAHFATMPRALAERAIQAGCRPGGTVLDPFSGSGTTGLAAARHGRKYVGIDLNAEYLDLSLRTRLAQPSLDFGDIA